MLSQGSIDAKNRLSLESSTPLPTNGHRGCSWQMHARTVVPAGHRIGIVIVTNHDGYVAVDTAASGIALNLSLGVSKVVLPVVGGVVVT